MHARGTGRIYDRQRLVGGGGRRSPGRRRSVLGEEVGSGRDRYFYDDKRLLMEKVGWMKEHKTIHKQLSQVGRAGI